MPTRLASFAVCLLAVLAAPSPARAAPQTLVILDYSSSMWGQIGATPKFQIAADVVARRLAQLPALSAGVLTFGHTKPLSCTDAAIVAPLAPGGGEVATALAELRPKGAASIAASLDAAANAFAPGGPRSAVLIVDGIDNCRGDPCAAAERLATTAGLDALHAIVFDPAADRLPALRCLARGKGRFAAATTREAFEAAVAAAMPTGGAAPVAVRQPAPDSLIGDPNLPGAVSLAAVLAAGAAPVSHGLEWRIFAAKPESNGRYRLIANSAEPRPTITLPPGDYLVHCAFGRAHTTRRLAVIAGQNTSDEVVLNAGALRLSVTVGSKPATKDQDITVDLYSDDSDQAGNRRKIVGNVPVGAPIRLNSGIYHVISAYGDGNAQAEADLTVEPGKLTEATIDHRAGRMTFRLVATPGGEAIADTSWNILSDSGELIKRSAGAFPTHVLAAGRYQVRAENGGKTYAHDFEVVPGDVRQVEVLIQ